jgi:hypothetical protein
VHPHELQWGEDAHIDRLLEEYTAGGGAAGALERWGAVPRLGHRSGGRSGRHATGVGQMHGRRATFTDGPGLEAHGGIKGQHRRQVASEGDSQGRYVMWGQKRCMPGALEEQVFGWEGGEQGEYIPEIRKHLSIICRARVCDGRPKRVSMLMPVCCALPVSAPRRATSPRSRPPLPCLPWV